MPRSIWKGVISFGLVAIPVRLYTATADKEVKFNLLHDKDQGPVEYQRKCKVCGEIVTWDNLVRGYEYEKGRWVVMTDEELQAVPLDTTHRVDIVEFVPAQQIDPIYFQKSYYLVPEDTGVKAYALLREAMRRTQKIAIAKVVLRQKEHLVTMRPYGEAFVMETMYYPDEIREADFDELGREVEVRDQEMAMAESLIDNLTDEFNPGEFRDRYREALVETIERKIAGEEISVPTVAEEAVVIDLMEALRQSVEGIKDQREKAQVAKGA